MTLARSYVKVTCLQPLRQFMRNLYLGKLLEDGICRAIIKKMPALGAPLGSIWTPRGMIRVNCNFQVGFGILSVELHANAPWI